MKTADKNGEAAPPVVRVTSADALRQLVAKPVLARVFINGEIAEIPCRRLTPAESDRVRQVFTRALPPLVQVAGETPTFDLSNPQYEVDKAEAEAQGRALAVWIGCELYRDSMDLAATDLVKIREHCESLFTNDVYRAVFLAVTGSDETVGEHASFTSAVG